MGTTHPQYRTEIVLPPEERALADAIAQQIGQAGNRSAAIRFALREVARDRGISTETGARKKIRKNP